MFEQICYRNLQSAEIWCVSVYTTHSFQLGQYFDMEYQALPAVKQTCEITHHHTLTTDTYRWIQLEA